MKKTILILLLFFVPFTFGLSSSNKSSSNLTATTKISPESGIINVLSFGAKGDSNTDDTDAFQKALDCAGENGAVVFVPTGKYLIKKHLDLPKNVTLEGIWQAPARGKPYDAGSTLLAVESKDDPNGHAFITMHSNSTIKGITVFYPEQIAENPPHAYPWTIKSRGDNCSIRDVLLLNPYKAVDFGTLTSGRHFIDGLYAQVLYRGISVDNCLDVGRIQNVHFWPFWKSSPGLKEFTQENCVGFIFARTDWEMVSNCFSIFHNVGFLFISGREGPGNVMISSSGADLCRNAVRIEQLQTHSGVTFTNCQMMAGVEVMQSNTGPVKFIGTGFWATGSTTNMTKLQGKGFVLFEGCHFNNWDSMEKGDYCIDANCDQITINTCLFMQPKKHIRLGKNVKSAIITSNQFTGKTVIENETQKADVQIGLNAGY